MQFKLLPLASINRSLKTRHRKRRPPMAKRRCRRECHRRG